MKTINLGFILVPMERRIFDAALYVLYNKDTDEWIVSGFHTKALISDAIEYLLNDYSSNTHMFSIGKIYENVLRFKSIHKKCKIEVDTVPFRDTKWTYELENKVFNIGNLL